MKKKYFGLGKEDSGYIEDETISPEERPIINFLQKVVPIILEKVNMPITVYSILYSNGEGFISKDSQIYARNLTEVLESEGRDILQSDVWIKKYEKSSIEGLNSDSYIGRICIFVDESKNCQEILELLGQKIKTILDDIEEEMFYAFPLPEPDIISIRETISKMYTVDFNLDTLKASTEDKELLERAQNILQQAKLNGWNNDIENEWNSVSTDMYFKNERRFKNKGEEGISKNRVVKLWEKMWKISRELRGDYKSNGLNKFTKKH